MFKHPFFFKIQRLIKKGVEAKGMVHAIIEFAEFATSLTPSKKDDEVVAKLKKAMEKVEDEVKSLSSKADKVKEVVKEVEDVKKAVKKATKK